jgi:hypothetical protein
MEAKTIALLEDLVQLSNQSSQSLLPVTNDHGDNADFDYRHHRRHVKKSFNGRYPPPPPSQSGSRLHGRRHIRSGHDRYVTNTTARNTMGTNNMGMNTMLTNTIGTMVAHPNTINHSHVLLAHDNSSTLPNPAVSFSHAHTQAQTQNPNVQHQNVHHTVDTTTQQPRPVNANATSLATKECYCEKAKELRKTSILESNYQKFREWLILYNKHRNCCNKKKWPQETQVYDLTPTATCVHSFDDPLKRVVLTKKDLRRFQSNHQHVRIWEYDQSITESACWKSCRLKTSVFTVAQSPSCSTFRMDDVDKPETIYVNFTNMLLPGYGFVGHVPPAKLLIDDPDELALFWSTDLSLYLHPSHPILKSGNQTISVPLKMNQTLYCPNVSIFDFETGVCATRDIGVANIVIDPIQIMCARDTQKSSWKEYQKQLLTQLLNSILQLVERTGIRIIILPLGRFMRLNFDIELVSTMVCDIFLDAMKQNKIQMVELLLPNQTNKKKDDKSANSVNWGDYLLENLNWSLNNHGNKDE